MDKKIGLIVVSPGITRILSPVMLAPARGESRRMPFLSGPRGLAVVCFGLLVLGVNGRSKHDQD